MHSYFTLTVFALASLAAAAPFPLPDGVLGGVVDTAAPVTAGVGTTADKLLGFSDSASSGQGSSAAAAAAAATSGRGGNGLSASGQGGSDSAAASAAAAATSGRGGNGLSASGQGSGPFGVGGPTGGSIGSS
ncbi:hypothetical protein GGI17_003357 [Coemansia sp. S146]|nr:hypothetical protein GGI17_003357 [Coemansia sp. S146]